ncbi:MAG TPA: sulfite exporter TauE/SafE family protein [bacterium]|nr:sulfite exporter TauE/SafE family protein [bacterium]
MITVALLLKGLAAAIIVGFVTASIKSWVDRVFLVIMLVGLVGLPISDAIIVNLAVVALAALLMVVRQRKMLSSAIPTGKAEWLLIIIPALLGGIGGRLAGSALGSGVLLFILGVYAILVGIRILLIKPLPERETKTRMAWIGPVSLASGVLAGLISAGGKPFTVPAYNNAMGHHPQRAYAFASLGVAVASWAAMATQLAVISMPSLSEILLALYEFVLITAVALVVNRFWSQKLNKIVNLVIAPVLVLVGIRFILLALS